MAAIPVTIFFSLLLAAGFVCLFAREQRRQHGSPERDSLLPLADEQFRPVAAETDVPNHDHDNAGCGCRDGARPPCVACLKRTPALSPRQ